MISGFSKFNTKVTVSTNSNKVAMNKKSSNQRQFKCELCNVRSAYSEEALRSHTNSKAHAHMRLFLDNALWPGPERDLPADVGLVKPQVYQFTHESGEINCRACREVFSDASALLDHQMTVEHQRRMLAFDTGNIVPKLFYCSVCNLCTGTNQASFQIHLASGSHIALAGPSRQFDARPASQSQWNAAMNSSNAGYSSSSTFATVPQSSHDAFDSRDSRGSAAFGNYAMAPAASAIGRSVSPYNPQAPLSEQRRPGSIDDPATPAYVMSVTATTHPWLAEDVVVALIKRKKLREMMTQPDVNPNLISMCKAQYQTTTMDIEKAMLKAKKEFLESRGVMMTLQMIEDPQMTSDVVERVIINAFEGRSNYQNNGQTMDVERPRINQQNVPQNAQLQELMLKAADDRKRQQMLAGYSEQNSLLTEMQGNNNANGFSGNQSDSRSSKRQRSRSRSRDRDRNRHRNRERDRQSEKDRNGRHRDVKKSPTYEDPSKALYKKMYANVMNALQKRIVGPRDVKEFHLLMDLCSESERRNLLTEVVRLGDKDIATMVLDKATNGLFKFFIQYASDSQKLDLARVLFRSFMRITCHPEGSQIMQALITSVGVLACTKEKGADIAEALKGKVSKLVFEGIGSFVIKEVLTNGSGDQIKTLVDELFNHPPHIKDLPSDSLARAKNIRQCLNLCTIADKKKLLMAIKGTSEAEVEIYIGSLTTNYGALMRALLLDDEACIIVEGLWEATEQLEPLRFKMFRCIPPEKMTPLRRQLVNNPTGNAILQKITGTCTPPAFNMPPRPMMPLPGFMPGMGRMPVPGIGIPGPWGPGPRQMFPRYGGPPMNGPPNMGGDIQGHHGWANQQMKNESWADMTNTGEHPVPVGTRPTLLASNKGQSSYSDLVTSNPQERSRQIEGTVSERLHKLKGTLLSLCSDADGSSMIISLVNKAPQDAIHMVFETLCGHTAFMPVNTHPNGVNVMCAVIRNCSPDDRAQFIQKLVDLSSDNFVRIVMEGSLVLKQLLGFEEGGGNNNGAEELFIKLVKIANENQQAVKIVGPLLNNLASGTLVRLVTGALQGRSVELIVERNAGYIVVEVFTMADARQRSIIILELRQNLWTLSSFHQRGADFLCLILSKCNVEELQAFIDALTANYGALIVKMLAQRRSLMVVDRLWSRLSDPMRMSILNALEPKMFALSKELPEIAAVADQNPDSSAAIIFKEMFERNSRDGGDLMGLGLGQPRERKKRWDEPMR